MSFPYDNSFQGQPGADDSNAQGVAGGQPQPQMGQPIESAAGQFQGGNMPVGAPNAAQPGPGGEAKTTLWYVCAHGRVGLKLSLHPKMARDLDRSNHG